MKKMITLIALVAIVMLVAATSFAQNTGVPTSTLWGKLLNGTDNSGSKVNPKANGCNYDGTAALVNWTYQYGNNTFSCVYSHGAGEGWYGTSTGADDGSIDVRADVEMYFQSTTSNEKIYFHIANPFTVTAAQNQAIVTGTQETNHAMYVGITIPCSGKSMPSWGLTNGVLNGKVTNGMQSKTNTMGTAGTGSTMDVSFLMSTGGAWLAPTSAGTPGADGTIPDTTMWWDPSLTGVGATATNFLVQIYPSNVQADGVYTLDPVISVSPAL